MKLWYPEANFRRLLWLFRISVSVVFLSACTAERQTETVISHADALLKANDVAAAQQLISAELLAVGVGDANSARRAALLDVLGQSYIRAGRLAEAQRCLLESAALTEARFGTDAVQLMEPLERLRQLYAQQRQFDAAEKLARRILSIGEKAYGQDDPRLEPVISNVLAVACVSGRCKDESELTARLLTMRVKLFGPDHANTRAARLLLAETYQHHGDYAKVVALMDENVASCRRSAPQEVVTSLNNLAHALEMSGDTTRGMQVIQQAADLQKKASGKAFRTEAISTLKVQAALLAKQGNYAQAESAYRLLIDKSREVYGEGYSHLPDYMLELSEVLSKQGKTAQAKAMHDAAEHFYKHGPS